MKKLFLLLVTFFLPLTSHALVDMRNANFADTWVDLEIPGSGYNLQVQRTYNSRSLFNGMFGYGWCSDFETSLEPSADGNLKLTECGAGMEVIYSTASANPKEAEQASDDIITKLKAKNPNMSRQYFKDLALQLKADRRLRDKYFDELGMHSTLQKGSVFLANGHGPDFIEKKDSLYIRRMPGGESQKFDLKGRLTQLQDKNGNYLQFNYDNEKIKDVVDNNGKKLSFTFYSNRKVKKIVGPNNLKSEYEFKNLNDLHSVNNGWNHTYLYSYDDLHNLNKIQFPDKTTKVLTYDTNKDWVTSFKDRNNCKEDYKYELSKDDPKNHYWSTVLKKCEGKTVSQGRYEFWYKFNKSKSDKYLARVFMKNNEEVTDVTYHEVFGKPISLTKNGATTKYEYDDKTGLLKSRKENNRLVKFEYDNVCKKVETVSEGKLSTHFGYDGKCNLTSAHNSKGQTVSLTYDMQGRIATLVDQAKRQVNIAYDEKFGKPKTVERPGVGSLKVTYKSNGEINKVDSPSGPTVAVQVAGAFNNLLEVVEPAGVDLGL